MFGYSLQIDMPRLPLSFWDSWTSI